MAYAGNGYSGRGSPIYHSPISGIKSYNPIQNNVIYKHKESGLTYVSGTSYHSQGNHSQGNSFKINDFDRMFDSRASKRNMYMPFDDYLKPKNDLSSSYQNNLTNSPRIIFNPGNFLRQDRPETRWVGRFEEVKEIVEKIYKIVTQNDLPHIEINIVSKEKLYQEYEKSGKKADEALQGFYSYDQIFVKEGRLDQMILTLGHELGHASSVTLADPSLEEAKAYAFTEAWVKAIVEEDIEGLSRCIKIAKQDSIIPEWAEVHLKGYDIFKKRLADGLSPMEIIDNIISIDRSNF